MWSPAPLPNRSPVRKLAVRPSPEGPARTCDIGLGFPSSVMHTLHPTLGQATEAAQFILRVPFLGTLYTAPIYQGPKRDLNLENYPHAGRERSLSRCTFGRPWLFPQLFRDKFSCVPAFLPLLGHVGEGPFGHVASWSFYAGGKDAGRTQCLIRCCNRKLPIIM